MQVDLHWPVGLVPSFHFAGYVRMLPSPAYLCPSLLCPNSDCPPHSFGPTTLCPLWWYDIYSYDPCPGIPPSLHHHNSILCLPCSPLGGPLWEVPSGRWEVVFYLVWFVFPHPSSLALGTFPEEQDFLWRYQHTFVCWTCCHVNCWPLSLADNSNLGLSSIFWWYSSTSHFLLLFLLALVNSWLQWSLVIISCQVYPSLRISFPGLCTESG